MMSRLLILLALCVFPVFGTFPDICSRCWYEVPDSELKDVFPDPAPPGTGGINSRINWSGAAFDTRRSQLIIAGGGGGSDNSGNEVYAFNVDSLKWFRLNDPSPIFDDSDAISPYYFNGGEEPDTQQPRPGYTYDLIQYDSISDKIFIMGLPFAAQTSYGWSTILAMHMGTLTWSSPGSMNPYAGSGSVSSYDPVTRKIWVFANESGPGSFLGQYDISGNTWTDHGSIWTDDHLEIHQNSAIMPSTQRMISVGTGYAKFWDITGTGNIPSDDLEPTDCDTLMAYEAPGFAWHPGTRKMMGWVGGTRVITMDSTYTCEDVLANDSNEVTPDAPNPYGTYGRWQYVPKHNVFVVVNSADSSVWLYRPGPGGGSPPSPPVVIITNPSTDTTVQPDSILIKFTVDAVPDSQKVALDPGPNQIIISRTNAGGTGKDTVNVYRDNVAPVVVITSPANHKGFASSPATIAWTVDAVTQTTQLTEALVHGANTVTRTATDAVGNIGSASITVYLDTVKPVVIITSPANGFQTNQATAAIAWTVDGSAQTTQLTEALSVGSNLVLRTATDSLGNEGRDSITIIRDTIAPVVVITAPPADTLYTTNIATVAWTVDGVAQTTQLTETLTADGARLIIRTATDAAGNIGRDTVRVFRDMDPPVVVITSPEQDSLFVDQAGTWVAWTVDGIEQTSQLFHVLAIEGNNYIIRTATDTAGNIGADTVRVQRDNIGPVITLVSPAQSAAIPDTGVDVQWKIDEVSQTPVHRHMDSSEVNVVVLTAADSVGHTDTLKVFLYSGILVPNLIGKTYYEADSILRVKALGKDSSWVNNETVATGEVFEQSPAAGDTLPFHHRVRYKISRGPDARDLAPISLETKDMLVNPLSLTASGFVRLVLGNQGRHSVEDSFQIIVFEDKNKDLRYANDTDLYLGSVISANDIGVGDSAIFAIAVSGGLTFNGNRITTVIDYGNDIPETNEGNNVIHSMANCKNRPEEIDYTPMFKWRWMDTVGNSRVINTPYVAHLKDDNGDGKYDVKDMPQVIFATATKLVALDGKTGHEVFRKDATLYDYTSPAIGDIDGDGVPEIAVIDVTSYTWYRRVLVFDNQGNRKDSSAYYFWGSVGFGTGFSLSFHDMDGDGKSEILWGHNIFDRKGRLIFPKVYNNWWYYPQTVADLDQDGFQEVVGQVTLPTETDAKLSLFSFKNKDYTTRLTVPVNPDVPIVGRFGGIPRILFSNVGSAFSTTYGFRLYNMSLDSSRLIMPTTFPNPGPGSFVLVNGNDMPFFGKDSMELLFDFGHGAQTNLYGSYSPYPYHTRLDIRDSSITFKDYPQPETEGNTLRGTIFDFADDNHPEMIVRMSDSLLILDDSGEVIGLHRGIPGRWTWGYSAPMIADIDQDHHADIITMAGNDSNGLFAYSNPTWVGARSIYNQRDYTVTNIDDDGRIPRFPVPVWAANNTRYVQCAEGFFACVDVASSLPQIVNNPLGQDTVIARIGNGGALAQPPGFPITLYADHIGRETKLATIYSPGRLEPGEYFNFRYAIPDSLRGAVAFRFAADDSGSGNGGLEESNEINNSVVLSIMVNNHYPVVESPGKRYAVPGVAFLDTIIAEDEDENDTLTYRLVEAPLGMSINSTTGIISWTPPADLPRITIRIAVSDNHQATTMASLLIYLDDGSNTPPVIETIPNSNVLLNALNLPATRVYRTAIVATDADNEALEFEMECLDCEGHGGAKPSLSENKILWIPFMPSWEDGDSLTLKVRVTDERGGIDSQTFVLYLSNPTVSGNHAPAIYSAPPTTVIAGSLYSYPFKAGDADGDMLSYTIYAGPTGMGIDGDTLFWAAPSAPGTTANVTLRVTDTHTATVNQSWQIAIRPDSIPPALNISFSRNPVRPGESVTVTVNARDNVGLDSRDLDSNGVGVTLISGTFTFTPSNEGEVLFSAEAEDTSANIGTSTAILRVRTDADHTPPTVSLSHTPTSPEVGDIVAFTVTASDDVLLETDRLWVQVDGLNLPVVDGEAEYQALRPGSFTAKVAAYDATGNSALGTDTYSVSPITGDTILPTADLFSPEEDSVVYSRVDVYGTAADANFAYYTLSYRENGSSTWVEFDRSTMAVSFNKVGIIDATTMENGDYEIRLDVYDRAGNHDAQSTKVTIAGEKKVGNFSLAFQDLSLPMSGLDLTVSRTYDSRTKVKGDFGMGWKMGLRSVSLHENRNQGEDWTLDLIFGVIPHYEINPQKTHSISVTLPGGRKQEFSPVPQFHTPFVPAFGRMTYVAKPGTYSKLEALDVGDFFILGGQLYDIDGDFEEAFNPQLYKLTLLDGSYFIIDETKGGVIESADANGNKVNWDSASIVHNSGNRIDFSRDSEGRVTGINDGAGRSMQYQYDVLGNLGRVVDGNGNITQFKYGPDHYLTDIVDARGVRANKTIYDDEGRIIKQVNAKGDTLYMTHDIDHNFEEIEDFNGNITSYVYDLHGNVTRKIDDAGKNWFFSYDSADNLLSTLNPDGTLKTSTYDDAGNEISSTDELGKTTTRTYNEQGKPLTVTDALDRTTAFEYDASGNLVKETGPDGTVLSQRTYDSRGNVVSEKDALGNLTTNTYNSAGWVLTSTNPRGHQKKFAYDAAGNITVDVNPRGDTTRFAYDNNGNRIHEVNAKGDTVKTIFNAINKPVRVTDALGNATRTAYGNLGDRVSDTAADNTVSTRTYDAQGNVATMTDAAGRTTALLYDFENRVIRTTFEDDNYTTTTYDARGRRIRTVDARLNETRYEYDHSGRNTAVIDALGKITRFEYDAIGRKTAMEDALGHRTEYEYDAYDRLVLTTYHDDSEREIAYDAAGRKIAETDPMGYTTHFYYDSTGNLRAVKGAIGDSTSYTYDQNNNRLTQRDANGHTTSMAYDALNRMTSKTYPNGNQERWTYDKNGNMLSHVKGTDSTAFQYDVMNREISRHHFNSGHTIATTYTDDGKRETVTDYRGLSTFSYDNRGRLAGEGFANGDSLENHYDANGNRTSVVTPFGTTSYTYDVLNRMHTVVSPQGKTTTYRYNAVGNRDSVISPNGVTSGYHYDDLNRLTRVRHYKAGGVLAHYAYTLNAAGIRTQVTEKDSSKVVYGYDSLYRLKSERRTGNHTDTMTYTYDLVGNRLSKLRRGVTTTYAYNNRDQMLSEWDGTDSTLYSYDAAGRMLTKSEVGGTTNYRWRDEDRLDSLYGPGVSVKYQYDADGRRVKDSTGSTVRQYLIDPLLPYGQVIAETDGSNSLVSEYIVGLDRVSLRRSGAVHYYLADGQGSTRLLTDSTGAATDSTVYTAFGETLFSSGSTPNSYLYTGEQLDGSAGLYNLRARLMNPRVGRFVSVDPFEGGIARPLSLNKYIYAEASPAWMTDPTGLFGLSEALGALTLNSILTSMARPQARVLAYVVYFRLFAPWETFGGLGFGGDNRSFSTSTDPSVTSRINSTVTIDVMGNRVLGSRAWSDPSHWGPIPGLGTPSMSVERNGFANSRTIAVSGAIPFLPGAPPIDATLTLSWKPKESGGVCFDGSVVGDAFPNAEVFVGRRGKNTSLHTFQTDGGRNSGPIERLPGKNVLPMGNFSNRCAD